MNIKQLLAEKLISRKLAVIGLVEWALIEAHQWTWAALVAIAHIVVEACLAFPERYFAARDAQPTEVTATAEHRPRPRVRTRRSSSG